MKSEAQWRKQLSPLEYKVLREAGTERAFTGEYTDTKTTGVYAAGPAAPSCSAATRSSKSHCGWPSFFAPLAEDRVV